MKTIKFYLFLIVIAAMLLSACGGAEETTAPEAGEPGTGEGLTTEDVELAFWSMWNESEPQALALTKLMDGFTALHPNITFAPIWNGRENQTKLRTALSAGTKVDFMDQDSDQLAGGMMSEGLGYPLDEFLTQNALDQDVPITEIFAPHVIKQHWS
jgi:ABC-type glycerol-3-phosphate transport system substrate-binding protein